MKRTKLLALALAGVMVLALLTGCGKTGMNARERAVAEGIAGEADSAGDTYNCRKSPGDEAVGGLLQAQLDAAGRQYQYAEH